MPVYAEESRFADVRLIVGRGWNGGFDEAKGALISDTQAKRLRFEAGGRSLLDVRFDQLRAARYEESKYPPRSFQRSGIYLTLHYVRDTGDPAFDVLRLPGGAAADLLAVIERDTDIRIERGPAASSFLGIPVHLAVGNRVEVTGEPSYALDLCLSSPNGDHNHAGLVATAMRVVNAIPAVVAAEAGIRTTLDLPLVTGRGLYNAG